MEKKKNQKKADSEGLLKKAETARAQEVRGAKGGLREGALESARQGEREGRQEGSRSRKKKAHSLWAKVVLRIVSIILIFALGWCAFAVFSGSVQEFFEEKTESRSALVEKQLSYCQELVTAKYRYSDIITLKKSAGFAKSYSIVKYTGLLRAGIADFTDVSYSLSADEKTVTITLPNMEILGNEIVKQEVFDEKQSIFVPITTQEIFDEIDTARQVAQEDMIAEGVLQDSEEYAKKIIRQFMLACGFEEVIFKK